MTHDHEGIQYTIIHCLHCDRPVHLVPGTTALDYICLMADQECRCRKEDA